MRVLLAATGHGFGHLAQSAPVIAALRARMPVELIVRTGLPRDIVCDRLGDIDGYWLTTDEFGLVMRDGIAIDTDATLARYRALHDRLPATIDAMASQIRAAGCDIVLSNMSYIATAAAAQAGCPSVAFCSLAWHEIADACLPDAAWPAADMLACYRRATRVLRLQPGTPLAGLDASTVQQPIVQRGRARRGELASRLNIDPQRPIALLSFSILPAERPALFASPGHFTLIAPNDWARHGAIAIDTLPMPYADVVASVDVVVTKPGYGITAELGCTGTPGVLVDRPGWPEQRYLVEWLQQHGRCLVVANIEQIDAAMLQRAVALPRPITPRPVPGGENDIVDAMLAAMQRQPQG